MTNMERLTRALLDHPHGVRQLRTVGDCICTRGRLDGPTSTVRHNGRNYSQRRFVAARLGLLNLDDSHLVVVTTCGHSRCVNPDHLATTTKSEQSHETVGYGRGTCKRGHPLTNIQNRPDGRRECRTCRNDSKRIDAIYNAIWKV